jgi:NADPH-dependent 2,4-dienoyl-CoA reductase/sulfur reductase-like enzyme
VPPIPGLDGANIFACRTVPDADAILARIEAVAAPAPAERGRALVIGGGYIGLECAEQLLGREFDVTLVEAQEQLMSPLDPEMVQPVQSALEAAGATVILSDAVARIEPGGAHSKALLRSGREVLFDVCLVGTGVRPSVELAKSAKLKLGASGAIAVRGSARPAHRCLLRGRLSQLCCAADPLGRRLRGCAQPLRRLPASPARPAASTHRATNAQ